MTIRRAATRGAARELGYHPVLSHDHATGGACVTHDVRVLARQNQSGRCRQTVELGVQVLDVDRAFHGHP